MDPQQELFSTLLVELKKYGYDVYDSVLPPDDTPYPFIYLGDSQVVDDIYKNATLCTVTQTVHVWHNNPRERGVVSQMLYAIKKVAYALTETKSYKWSGRVESQQILPDTSTSVPLMHGVITLQFKLTGGV